MYKTQWKKVAVILQSQKAKVKLLHFKDFGTTLKQEAVESRFNKTMTTVTLLKMKL